MIIKVKEFEVNIGPEEVDRIVQTQLVKELFNLVNEVNRIRRENLPLGYNFIDSANIKDNLLYIRGIKVTLSYLLPMNEYEEIFRQVDAKLYK